MFASIWKRLHEANLTLDQTSTPLEMEADQVKLFYLPLAETLISRPASYSRLMVGLAGPPGSGKSAFAAILCAVIDALAGTAVAAVVGLDGWHYTNAYLESHYIERDGKHLALKTYKGSPQSFDALSALACLQAIRQSIEVTYPVYSRILHDPVPAGGRVLASHRFVLVEGNFLLLDEPPWRQFQGVFDTGILLRASEQVCLAGLLERHRRGGKSEEAIHLQVQQVDLPNVRHIQAKSRAPEFVVTKQDARRIHSIHRWGGFFTG